MSAKHELFHMKTEMGKRKKSVQGFGLDVFPLFYCIVLNYFKGTNSSNFKNVLLSAASRLKNNLFLFKQLR